MRSSSVSNHSPCAQYLAGMAIGAAKAGGLELVDRGDELFPGLGRLDAGLFEMRLLVPDRRAVAVGIGHAVGDAIGRAEVLPGLIEHGIEIGRRPQIVDRPQDAGVGELGAEGRPGVDDDVDLFAAEQRRAHRTAHVALPRHHQLADGDAGVLGGEVGLELLPHLGIGAALPLQDDELAAQVLRPGGRRPPARWRGLPRPAIRRDGGFQT